MRSWWASLPSALFLLAILGVYWDCYSLKSAILASPIPADTLTNNTSYNSAANRQTVGTFGLVLMAISVILFHEIPVS